MAPPVKGRIRPKAPALVLYQLTPPHSVPAILPQWGAVAPFVLRSRRVST
jgi:hypothetical protein